MGWNRLIYVFLRHVCPILGGTDAPALALALSVRQLRRSVIDEIETRMR